MQPQIILHLHGFILSFYYRKYLWLRFLKWSDKEEIPFGEFFISIQHDVEKVLSGSRMTRFGGVDEPSETDLLENVDVFVELNGDDRFVHDDFVGLFGVGKFEELDAVVFVDDVVEVDVGLDAFVHDF